MKLIVFYCILLSIAACQLSEADQQKVAQLTAEMPPQKADSISMIYSEEGVIELKLEAPVLINNKKTKTNEFPEGLQLVFYDDEGNENARVNALYGLNDDRKQERILRDSVRIIDLKDSTTYTTKELYIDERKDSVHNNNQYVKITKPDGTLLQGIGFVSNTKMDNIRINSVTNSVMTVDESMMTEQEKAPNQ